MKSHVLSVLALLLVAGGPGRFLMAQNTDNVVTAPADSSRVIMDWEEFKQVTRWEEGAAADDDRNKFVIPWTDVQKLLAIDIEQVDTAELKLPWREFKSLLEWSVREAHKKEQEQEDQAPAPVPYLVTSAEYAATDLSGEGARFTGTFVIDVLQQKGWKKIDILPAEVAVSQADLPDGVHLQLSGGMYSLLTTNAGTINAAIEFSVAVSEAGGAHALSFGKIPSGTCVLDVTVPETGMEIEVSGAQSKLARDVDDGTRVVAALSAAMPISVSWERALDEAEAIPPKFYTETRTLVSVADGLLLGRTRMTFSILHTATRELSLSVPEGVGVLEVAGVSVRDWRVSDGTLTVQMDREIIGSYELDIKYEAPADMVSNTSALPVITGSGVAREKGDIGVVALTNVEIASGDVKGAHLTDVKNLPPEILGMTSQPVLLAYRYVDPGFEIGLKINKHKDQDVLLTVLDKAYFTVMQTLDGRRITRAIYSVRNTRSQFLRLRMPEGADIWSVSVAGRPTQPARDDQGRILVPLVRSQGSGGMSSFPVELVYAEQGVQPDESGSGTARVDLPVCSEPVMHLMVELHVPARGRYRDFAGTLHAVKAFTPVAGVAVPVSGLNAAQVLQQQYEQNVQANISAAGASPIDVQLPLSGNVYRLEKILVLGDAQWFSYAFSRLSR